MQNGSACLFDDSLMHEDYTTSTGLRTKAVIYNFIPTLPCKLEQIGRPCGFSLWTLASIKPFLATHGSLPLNPGSIGNEGGSTTRNCPSSYDHRMLVALPSETDG